MSDISREQMNGIWEALNAPRTEAQPWRSRAMFADIVEAGWFYHHQLEDLIYYSDRRLDDFDHKLGLREFSQALGYRWTNITRRPRQSSNGVIYSQALSLAEAASFLADLERLGFDIDPSPLIGALRPKLLKQKILTDNELTVFWYPKVHEKYEIGLQVAEKGTAFGDYRTGKFDNGYKYAVWFQKDGSPLSLTVTGPRFRQRRNPVETVCPECGNRWYRGDPDSSRHHRAEHKKRMRFLTPVPDERMLAAREEPDRELVRAQSPEWRHQEIYGRALAFKREEGYDFVQWHGPSGDDDPHVHGFLFTDADGVIVGAAAFRWREPEAPDRPFWGLQWVWVAPRYRRLGVLASRWPSFRERFGDFFVEGPVSEAMQAFLAKHGDEGLMRWPSRRGSHATRDSDPT